MVARSAVNASAIFFTKLCSLLVYKETSDSDILPNNGAFSPKDSTSFLPSWPESSALTRGESVEPSRLFTSFRLCALNDLPLGKSAV
jgi:hypothetical protein